MAEALQTIAFCVVHKLPTQVAIRHTLAEKRYKNWKCIHKSNEAVKSGMRVGFKELHDMPKRPKDAKSRGFI